ncbi:DMT family transporter [Oceanobacillus luteolus]|uniref:DMT family transporter n=1 Tax=Oceanobacillus luteolus TaxID=1274358 RepID=A0ABW4HM00_9BACI|nr:DMT family transporter [Oceanobacillus luteolus]MCM3742277.1 DMT family transporter [Oceanobacillus luteolus]
MRYIAYILALLGGILLSIQGAVYGQLGQVIGQLETNFYNFFVASILLGLLWLFFGKGNMSKITKVPKWTLVGGAFGVVYLSALIISVPYIGVGLAMLALILGQLITSMVIEHFGWLGSRRAKLNKEKIFAIISMLIALVLIY